MSRVVQRTLGKYAALSLVADQVGNLKFSCYTEDKPNTMWSDRKHLGTHEYFDELFDQVKPGNCFQSSYEDPSFFVVDLSQN